MRAPIFRHLLLLVVLAAGAGRAEAQPCGNPGRDGPGGVLTGVVNTYWPGTTAAAGGTTIAVGAPSGASNGIAVGDLLLVMQVQGASIATNNNGNYGGSSGTGSGWTGTPSAGRYEYVVATSALAAGSGGTVSIRGAGAGNGLLFAYTNADYGASGQSRFQVVRVPQYSSATFSSGLTALAWNGRTGGVLAVDVAGVLTLGGTVSVDGRGFRGGGGRQLGGAGGGSGTDWRNLSTLAFHGQKGEGIAGTPAYVFGLAGFSATGVEGYVNGSSARGAPGSAGGGGTDSNPGANDENSGGGGGSNWGAGGQGGRAWDSEDNVGGRGGASLSTLISGTASRLFMGGGGGAATTNNGTGTPGNGVASSGAPGGGIVMVRAGSVTGVGAITANGADANGTVLNDGSGGGGAGGTVMVFASSGGLGGLTVQARGGNGGSNAPGAGVAAHGPGGGGGGGVVALSSAAASITVAGGAAGTTNTSAYGLNFGATGGGAGLAYTALTVAQLSGAEPSAACLPALSIAKSRTSASPVVAGGTATYRIVVSNGGLSEATQVAIVDTLPTWLRYASDVSVTLGGSATRTSTVGTVAGDSIVRLAAFTVPAGSSVTYTFTVTVSGRAAGGTYQNSATATFLDPVRTAPTGTAAVTYAGSSGTAEDLVVTAVPDLVVDKRHAGTFVVGRPAAFSIAVRNEGGAATAGAITVVDTLRAGLTYAGFTGTGWGCAASGAVVTCTRAASLAARATADSIVLAVTVAAGAVPRAVNVAWVAGGGEGSANTTVGNSDADTARVVLVAVAVTPDSGTVTRLPSNGTQYVQAFTLQNLGSAEDTFALALETRPAAGRLAVVAVNGVPAPIARVPLLAGASTPVTVTYAVADTASAGAIDTLLLTAISGTAPTFADAGLQRVQVVRAALSMTKQLFRDDRATPVGPTEVVAPGTWLQYRVTVTSAGGAPAQVVQVTDDLPAPVAFDSAEGDAAGWTIAASGQTLTASLAGTLASGASRFFWVRVRVR